MSEIRLGRRRGERGAAAVEFAFVSVPVIVLLFGLSRLARLRY